MSSIPLGPVARFILDPPHTDMCSFSWIIYFGFNVHSGELDVSLAGCFRGKGCVVRASVDATGTQTICGWFLPFWAAPLLPRRMKAPTLSHLVATAFYFRNVSQIVWASHSQRRRECPLRREIRFVQQQHAAQAGSVFCRSLWSPRARASREDAKQPVRVWVWNTLCVTPHEDAHGSPCQGCRRIRIRKSELGGTRRVQLPRY